MSIAKLVVKLARYMRKFRLFIHFSKYASTGFWIIELLVSMVILSGIMLILFRFSCNMIALQSDSIKRLEAISCASSLLEGNLAKRGVFCQKTGDFKLDLKTFRIKILKHNLPKSIQKSLKKHSNYKSYGIEKANLVISWQTKQPGQKKNIKIVTGVTRNFRRVVS
ncbi:hypothetical protein ACFLYU_01420 [Candidatus Dependentiae bacterium]